MAESTEKQLIDVMGDGGILKEILVEGSGITAPHGSTVKVYYVGRLTDGTEFDKCISGEPFMFTINKGMVISGWNEGIKTMKKGEKSRLTCKSSYAYGAAGSPPKIPADATLVFEVELLDWDPEDISTKQDGSILREIIDKGTGFDAPKFGTEVDVSLVGECEGKEFFNSRVQFCLGEGSTQNVPKGVEKALKKMVKGEISKIYISSEYGFGAGGKSEFGIPPSAPLIYTITLHSFEIRKQTWSMTSGEKLEYAAKLKEKGIKYYAEQNYDLALKMWRKQCSVLDCDSEFLDKDVASQKSLLTSGYLNAALALLKTCDFSSARDACNETLKIDSNAVKALFRRGQALLSLNEPLQAKADFQKVLELEPDNKAAANYIAVCQKKSAELKAAEKKIYFNMFDKLSKQDKEVKS